YGIKNVKWLIAIEVTDYDYKGYWQQRGWTDEGHIKVISRIDSPGHYQDLKGPEAEIRGIAFGGAQGVGKVEVSTDGGKTWHLAEITQAYSPTAWVLWRYSWKIPGPGAYTVVVRATDGQGRSQPSQILQAYPAGSSGLHTIVALIE
ncbi:MAG TPA: oxidoreductase, partial [Nitrospiria bacterium]|nr:oxidoreductase [Nitrospiria bacterium]